MAAEPLPHYVTVEIDDKRDRAYRKTTIRTRPAGYRLDHRLPEAVYKGEGQVARFRDVVAALSKDNAVWRIELRIGWNCEHEMQGKRSAGTSHPVPMVHLPRYTRIPFHANQTR